MKIPIRVVNHIRRVIKIAREIHEEATPIGTLDDPEEYAISTPSIEELGSALLHLKEDQP